MTTAAPAFTVGRYTCPACTERFTSLAEKKQHLRLQHPKPAKS